MRLIIFLCMLVFFGGGALLLIKQSNPDLFYRIVNSTSEFKSAAENEAEETRVNSINILPISPEKKAILIAHTIYMEAPKQMVELALDQPRRKFSCEASPEVMTGIGECWLYHFAGDLKPTILVFNPEKNELVQAYRASAYGEIGHAATALDKSKIQAGIQLTPPR